MATKADQARAEAQRKGPSKTKKKAATKRSAQTAPRAMDRDTPRNAVKRAKAKKTDKVYAAEGTPAGKRPSRKPLLRKSVVRWIAS